MTFSLGFSCFSSLHPPIAYPILFNTFLESTQGLCVLILGEPLSKFLVHESLSQALILGNWTLDDIILSHSHSYLLKIKLKYTDFINLIYRWGNLDAWDHYYSVRKLQSWDFCCCGGRALLCSPDCSPNQGMPSRSWDLDQEFHIPNHDFG